MISFLPRGTRSAEDTILQELPDRNTSLPAHAKYAPVPIERPSIACLLMGQQLAHLVMIHQTFEHDLG